MQTLFHQFSKLNWQSTKEYINFKITINYNYAILERSSYKVLKLQVISSRKIIMKNLFVNYPIILLKKGLIQKTGERLV